MFARETSKRGKQIGNVIKRGIRSNEKARNPALQAATRKEQTASSMDFLRMQMKDMNALRETKRNVEDNNRMYAATLQRRIEDKISPLNDVLTHVSTEALSSSDLQVVRAAQKEIKKQHFNKFLNPKDHCAR